MEIKTIFNDFSRTDYNQKAVHPLQSWEWGEARKKMGIEVLRIGEFEEDSLKNVFQITFHPLPYSNLKIGYLPRSSVPSKQVLDLLQKEGKRRNCVFIKIEPNEKVSGAGFKVPGLLIESPHPLFPQWSQVLDLTKSEDDLLAHMKSKTRYNINLANRHNVTIKEMTNAAGFEIFAKLYFETCKRQNYHGHNKDYHRVIFETLQDSISHIFIAFLDDIPLAAYEVFIFNDVMYYPYGGSSLVHRNVMAPNLLMWDVIRFGKKCGCKTFDMWGSLPPGYPDNNPWAGFTRFKEGYGAEFVKFVGSFDLVIDPIVYPIYNLVDKIRKKIL